MVMQSAQGMGDWVYHMYEMCFVNFWVIIKIVCPVFVQLNLKNIKKLKPENKQKTYKLFLKN